MGFVGSASGQVNGIVFFLVFGLVLVLIFFGGTTFTLDFVETLSAVSEGILKASTEVFMFEDAEILLVTDFVKIVHVELADKWWEVLVAEVVGEDFCFEFFDVDDGEIGAFLIPGD